MQNVKIRLTGELPLLVHNSRMASPLDPYARALKAITGKRNKTEVDLMDAARAEFAGALYCNDEGPYVPSTWLLAALSKASFATAKIAKAKLQAAVLFDETEIPLLYDGPRDVDGLWGEGPGKSPFVDLRSVKAGQARVDRCRPRFDSWSVESGVVLDTEEIDAHTFKTVLEATERIGIGDFRPIFGRFSAEIL